MKDIRTLYLPLAGFFGSAFDDELRNQIEIQNDNANNIDIMDIDNDAIYQDIATSYVDQFIQEAKNVFDADVLIQNIKVDPIMTNNHNKQILADIDINSLPALHDMQDVCNNHGIVDFKELLITINESKSNIIGNLYAATSHKIEDYFDESYSKWDEVHLQFLLIAMVVAFDQNTGSAHPPSHFDICLVSFDEKVIESQSVHQTIYDHLVDFKAGN